MRKHLDCCCVSLLTLDLSKEQLLLILRVAVFFVVKPRRKIIKICRTHPSHSTTSLIYSTATLNTTKHALDAFSNPFWCCEHEPHVKDVRDIYYHTLTIGWCYFMTPVFQCFRSKKILQESEKYINYFHTSVNFGTAIGITLIYSAIGIRILYVSRVRGGRKLSASQLRVFFLVVKVSTAISASIPMLPHFLLHKYCSLSIFLYAVFPRLPRAHYCGKCRLGTVFWWGFFFLDWRDEDEGTRNSLHFLMPKKPVTSTVTCGYRKALKSLRRFVFISKSNYKMSHAQRITKFGRAILNCFHFCFFKFLNIKIFKFFPCVYLVVHQLILHFKVFSQKLHIFTTILIKYELLKRSLLSHFIIFCIFGCCFISYLKWLLSTSFAIYLSLSLKFAHSFKQKTVLRGIFISER